MSENKVNIQITDTNLEEFKKIIRKAIFLTHEEEAVFKAVPNETWRSIFAKNFDGNFEYARRVLLNKFKEIDKIDTVLVDREKNKIHNLDKATKMFTSTLAQKQKIVFITDFDNDGSLAQAIINEYLDIDEAAQESCMVEYAQTMAGAARGVNLPHVDHLAQMRNIEQDEEFLIVTADNGINSREEVNQILAKYPKAKVIITDHHNPDEHMVVEESERTVIFNPHYQPTPFYQNYNISGATTVGVLLKNVLAQRLTPLELNTVENRNKFEKMGTLFKVSNLLDYVHTHPADKPEKDYIVSKFLKLQPLLNINNSISKIITGDITPEAIEALQSKIPNLNVDKLSQEAQNIHTQNHIAKVLLHVAHVYTEKSKEESLTSENFQTVFLEELTNQAHILDNSNANANYIEQLRPLIFSLAADYDKNTFLDAMSDQMEKVFESIRVSERLMAQELRAGEVVTKQKLPNSTIAYADPNVLSIFNRKFLNKVYNDENPGFSLTLDSIKPSRVSGSFRSIYDISDILPVDEKAKLEKSLNVRIETPGHERAAGFILISRDPQKNPITEKTIEAVNTYINDSIEKLRLAQQLDTTPQLLVDFNSIGIVDRINKVARGNISNFELIRPLIQLGPDTVWTDSYTTEQFTLAQIAKNKKYGYITINTDFHDGTLIVPVELIRKIVERDYQDYFSLGYMDGGVFMVDKVVAHESVKNLVDLRANNEKEQLIERAWQTDFKDKNIIELSRAEIRDNPFFKYHDYGQLNFDLFERMVIGVLDENKVDYLSIFDVEANGFGNSKIINFGATNYSINPDSGHKIKAQYFRDRFYQTDRGEHYLLSSDDVSNLRMVDAEEITSMPLALKKFLLRKNNAQKGENIELGKMAQEAEELAETEEDIEDILIDSVAQAEEQYTYYIHKDAEQFVKTKLKNLPFTQIKNYVETEDGEVFYNREIKASMNAYLIKDVDFKMPQEMVNLTGITQRLLNKYGIETKEVDKQLSEYYGDKKVLFGAHNTPYDARVIRANLPQTYQVLKKNKIYDSALFAKEKKLAYDVIKVAFFTGIDGLPKSIQFYNNTHSDFNLTDFIKNNKDGYYPDRSGNYLLEIDGANYYLVDKIKHEKVKITADQPRLLACMESDRIPNTSVKYSVEKLSEQWMVHALLLSDEKFDIKLVDLTKPEYHALLPHKQAIEFYQQNYHFDNDEETNLTNFQASFAKLEDSDEAIGQLYRLSQEFLASNRNIQQKFADAWMYKKVLSIKDPIRVEVTNDLVDLVHYQTNIPVDKIRTIFDEAIKFKDKYKISHIIHHEAHANGPVREDAKGDVAFEDKLTLGLLSQRQYNSYAHDVGEAIEDFQRHQKNARLAFDVADLNNEAAQDSYSFRQGIQYDREEISEVIKRIQEREANLSSTTERAMLKFKLDNDLLPPDTAVYAISKETVSLTRAQVEEHKKKLSFVVLYLQLEYSLGQKARDNNMREILEKPYVKKILEANFDKALTYKKELMDAYDYIEFNRKDHQFKEIIKEVKARLADNNDKKWKQKMYPDIGVEGFDMLNQIVGSLIKKMQSGHTTEAERQNIKTVKKMMTDLVLKHTSTSLENAWDKAAGTQGFTDTQELRENNFLSKVEISKQNLGKKILTENLDLRLVNNFIQSEQEKVLSKQQNCGSKMKM